MVHPEVRVGGRLSNDLGRLNAKDYVGAREFAPGPPPHPLAIQVADNDMTRN